VKGCPHCGRRLPLPAFHVDRSQPSGRTSWCAECRRAAQRRPGGRGPLVRVSPDAAERACLGPCGRTLPVAAFPPHQLGVAGRAARCRECVNRWRRERRRQLATAGAASGAVPRDRAA
jgi:hypothetical protein